VRNHARWSPAALPKPGREAPWEVLLELAARVNGSTLAQLDELALGALLGATLGAPGTACPGVSAADARARLGDAPGPERLLDLMLRAGPYGDRFDDGAPGLSLARLEAAAHGVDLGPLAPSLPDLLGTASGAIELAPDLLVADVPGSAPRSTRPRRRPSC
jgi:hypothetical protein